MGKQNRYFVYILRCADKTYYTGVTNDMARRFQEHQSAKNPKAYTASRRPLKMVYLKEFSYILNAIAFEKKIKKWSAKKKQALINENWEELKQLSKCMNESSHDGYEGD
ncbi:MAG: GIY-YIG nuclease family protein [Vicingaceae bacterium]